MNAALYRAGLLQYSLKVHDELFRVERIKQVRLMIPTSSHKERILFLNPGVYRKANSLLWSTYLSVITLTHALTMFSEGTEALSVSLKVSDYH